MVVKDSDNKKVVNEEVYKLLLNLLQFETIKTSFVISGRIYFEHHGLDKYKKFFCRILESCQECKCTITNLLFDIKDEIPEMKIPEMSINFENSEDVFKQLAGFEDKAYSLFEELLTTAYETKDGKVLAYALDVVKNQDHLCCRALEAVRNNANPNDLFKSPFANNISW